MKAPDHILGDIHATVAVYRQMVGTLYPSIIYRDLVAMRNEYLAAGGDLGLLPSIPPPRHDGRSPY